MIAFVIACAVTAGAVAVLLPVLHHKQVMDVPNERSSHSEAVPRGGGLGVVLGITCSALVAAAAGVQVWWPLLLTCLVLAAVGFVDDVRTLGGLGRLLVQLGVGTVLALWLSIESPDASWPVAAFLLLAVIGFTAYVNAFNFMDGINGISGLVALVSGAWFGWIGAQHGLDTVAILGLATAGASIGFLPWNVPRARIFLGDVGSYALGAIIVGLALYSWAHGVPVLTSSAPLLVYLADTAWALAKRAARQAQLSEAHREHVYQRLVDRGWTHTQAAVAVAGVCAALCGIATLDDFAGVLSWTLSAAVLATYLFLPRLSVDRWVGRRVVR